jgi:hypothetical protein
MAGKQVRVLTTLTSDLGKILSCMHGAFILIPCPFILQSIFEIILDLDLFLRLNYWWVLLCFDNLDFLCLSGVIEFEIFMHCEWQRSLLCKCVLIIMNLL